LDDPEPMLDALAALAAPGGIVSVLAKNARVLALRPAHERRWRDVLNAFDATREGNGLGIETRAETVEQIAPDPARRGINLVDWYGVRLFTDAWTKDDAEIDADDDVIAAELEASRRDPYRQLSRLFHLVGKQAPRSG